MFSECWRRSAQTWKKASKVMVRRSVRMSCQVEPRSTASFTNDFHLNLSGSLLLIWSTFCTAVCANHAHLCFHTVLSNLSVLGPRPPTWWSVVYHFILFIKSNWLHGKVRLQNDIHRGQIKKKPLYYQVQLSHFVVDFYNFCNIGTEINTPQLHIIYLLKVLMTS